jgi:predicted transcriptional regulator
LQISEFRLIKHIGSGAYGEVWLAESVTGAMRAVKIVWREDFEMTKTFHREFLGIPASYISSMWAGMRRATTAASSN